MNWIYKCYTLLENIREEKKKNSPINKEDKNLPCYGFSVVFIAESEI